MSERKAFSYSTELVTDPADIPTLATVFDESLKSDSFHQLLILSSPESVFDTVVRLLTEALHDPNHHVFKAVVEEHDENGTWKRTIVGVSQWFVGYISIPKVDPFEPKTITVVEEAPVAPVLPVNKAARKAHAEARKQGLNAYIRAIRGKKHVYLRRVAVLPAYQGRGIATRLVQWGADLADREGLVGWLNARPAGLGIYKKFGWAPVASVSFDVPGITTEPVVSMFRERKVDRKAGG